MLWHAGKRLVYFASMFPDLIETCRFLSDPRLDGRAPGTAGHAIAAGYLRERMAELELSPLFDGQWEQPIRRLGQTIGENLAGIRHGTSGRTILLGAHYDHFEGVPGADDNAAAVAIVMDVVRQLADWRGRHDLVLCFFDLEEPPYFHSPQMGSIRFVDASPLPVDQIECAIILDLCGHDVPIPGHAEAVFALGAEGSTGLLQAIQAARVDGLSVYPFANARVGDMSDHHAFRKAGVPFLFFTCGRWEHYHQPTDTFDRLNLAKMQRLADYLVQVVKLLDDIPTRTGPVPDFSRVELENLMKLTGGLVMRSPGQEIAELMSRFGL